MDDYDIATTGTFDGVQFGLHNGEEVVIDYLTFYDYLCKACASHIEDFPQDEEKIKEILAKVKQKFNL